MPRHIAFLRAVNVGGRVIKMDHLRRLFGQLRFEGVETFIASGNVVFDHAPVPPGTLEARIEAHLARALGYEVATFIRTARELAAIVDGVPDTVAARHADGGSLYVAFLKSALPAATRRKVEALASDIEEPHVRRREIYWLCRGGFMDSALSRDVLGRALGVSTTVRSISTLRRLSARHPA